MNSQSDHDDGMMALTSGMHESFVEVRSLHHQVIEPARALR